LLLLERHVATSKAIAEVADARAEAGLIPGIDADIALAEVVRSRASLAREHAAVQQADAQLALLLGGDPLTSEVRATGRLAPLPFEPDVRGSTDMALQTRPELSRVRAEQDQHRQTEALLKRDRLPDPTLSVFVQQDGFGEQVIGGGISFPIPLPAPLGQTDRGRIQESRARARAAQADLAVAQREVRLEVMQAHTQLRAEREALAAHDEALLERAREDLIALAREIEAGRLDVGDALVAQQALIDLLGRHVEAKRRVAVASVRLVQVSGEPFEAGAR
jgi:cobalt-zinc-cadmium efflux system outer membrane protein